MDTIKKGAIVLALAGASLGMTSCGGANQGEPDQHESAAGLSGHDHQHQLRRQHATIC